MINIKFLCKENQMLHIRLLFVNGFKPFKVTILNDTHLS